MGLTAEEEKKMPPAKRRFVLKAEWDARLAALEGGDDARHHLGAIKWLAAEVWELSQQLGGK